MSLCMGPLGIFQLLLLNALIAVLPAVQQHADSRDWCPGCPVASSRCCCKACTMSLCRCRLTGQGFYVPYMFGGG